jgi:hypothetical protein
VRVLWLAFALVTAGVALAPPAMACSPPPPPSFRLESPFLEPHADGATLSFVLQEWSRSPRALERMGPATTARLLVPAWVAVEGPRDRSIEFNSSWAATLSWSVAAERDGRWAAALLVANESTACCLLFQTQEGRTRVVGHAADPDLAPSIRVDSLSPWIEQQGRVRHLVLSFPAPDGDADTEVGFTEEPEPDTCGLRDRIFERTGEFVVGEIYLRGVDATLRVHTWTRHVYPYGEGPHENAEGPRAYASCHVVEVRNTTAEETGTCTPLSSPADLRVPPATGPPPAATREAPAGFTAPGASMALGGLLVLAAAAVSRWRRP